MGTFQITHRPILVLLCHYGESELWCWDPCMNTHISQHTLGIIFAYCKSLYFGWTCSLGGETADSTLWWQESTSLRIHHSLETERVDTAIHICQMCCRLSWPMIKSRLDGGHGWLTLIQTFWKHALAWGCLSLTNMMVWPMKIIFATITEIPTVDTSHVRGNKLKSMAPSISYSSHKPLTNIPESSITQAYNNSLHATWLFSCRREFLYHHQCKMKRRSLSRYDHAVGPGPRFPVLLPYSANSYFPLLVKSLTHV